MRTAHLLAFAALYGGALYAVPPSKQAGALAATVATGLALSLLELYRFPGWVVQLRGAATLIKIGLLAFAQGVPGAALELYTLAAVIGAVGSHMPGRWRYRSWLHGRVIGKKEKG